MLRTIKLLAAAISGVVAAFMSGSATQAQEGKVLNPPPATDTGSQHPSAKPAERRLEKLPEIVKPSPPTSAEPKATEGGRPKRDGDKPGG